MSVCEKINSRAIQSTKNILQALKKMDEVKVKMLLVFECKQFLSILTIGDIQRAVIKGVNMTEPITSILQTK